MHIAIVVPRWGDTVVGGAERLARAYADMLTPHHRLDIVTTCALDHVTWENTLPEGSRREKGCTVRRFSVDLGDRTRYVELQGRINHGENLSPEEERQWQRHGVVSRALNEHLADTYYDLVIAMPYFFGVVQQALQQTRNTKVLVPCLHPEPQAALGVVREMFAGVDAVFFNAPEERALASRRYALPVHRPVIGMGLAVPETRAELSPVPGRYIIYLGRKEEGKGTHTLAAYFLRYLERYPGSALRLVVAGGGELPQWSQLRERIIEFDWLPEEEKRSLLAGAVALVQPSRYESLSIVTLEAWAEGCPVLVNGQSAVQRGNVERSHGGLWYDDVETFIRSLRWLEGNPGCAADFGTVGRSYLRRRHDPAVIRTRLLRAVNEVTAAGEAHPHSA